MLAGDWCFMLFSFDVEQMAASAQEKMPAALADNNKLSPVFLFYSFLPRLSLGLLRCAELCL